MRILQSSIFRAFCAIVVGVLLICNPDSTVNGITIAIGILFLVSGVISCIAYYNARRQGGENIIINAEGKKISGGNPTFPIVGLGSLILGLILALMPGMFIRSLMYVLGALVILAAVNQLLSLINASKFRRMPFGYWVLPIMILLVGLFIIVKPMETAATPLIIIGVSLVAYGISECINSIVIHREQKKFTQLTKSDEYVEYTEE